MKRTAVAIGLITVVSACNGTAQPGTTTTETGPATTITPATTAAPATTAPPTTVAETTTTAAEAFDLSTLTESQQFFLVQVCDWATGTGTADTASLHAMARSGGLAAPPAMIEAILALEADAHPDAFRAAIAPHCALVG
jgi:hypothetical protein